MVKLNKENKQSNKIIGKKIYTGIGMAQYTLEKMLSIINH